MATAQADTDVKRICIIMCDFAHKDGINRVIADFAGSFRDRVLLCVARYDPSVVFKIPESTEVLVFKHWKCSLSPLSLGVWRFFVARMLAKKEGGIILSTHKATDIIHAAFIKLILFNKNVRISPFIYDKFELVPADYSSRNFKVRLKIRRSVVILLIKLGIVSELLTLDLDMQQFVRTVLRTDRVLVVRIGVSQSLLSLNELHNLIVREQIQRLMKGHCFKIFFQGILIPERNIEDLLAALFALVGDGKISTHLFIGGASSRLASNYVAAIKGMVSELKLDDYVHFLGELAEEELAFMYRNCDAFVWPGDDQSWGLAPLEAMLFRTPTIISAGNGVSEVLNEDVAIVVPKHNPEAIQRAIETLMYDNAYAEALGKRAQDFVKRRFTFNNTANELERIWHLKD